MSQTIYFFPLSFSDLVLFKRAVVISAQEIKKMCVLIFFDFKCRSSTNGHEMDRK